MGKVAPPVISAKTRDVGIDPSTSNLIGTQKNTDFITQKRMERKCIVLFSFFAAGREIPILFYN